MCAYTDIAFVFLTSLILVYHAVATICPYVSNLQEADGVLGMYPRDYAVMPLTEHCVINIFYGLEDSHMWKNLNIGDL